MPQQVRPLARARGPLAFTIVEVLVALTILVVLTAVIVPVFTGIDQRQARLAVDELEDLLRMYAYRDATSAQPVRLSTDPATGEILLEVLDIDPEYPDDPAFWRPDRFTPPLLLPDVVAIVDVRIDGRRYSTRDWWISRPPNGTRPLLEIDLDGADGWVTLSLPPTALGPVRYSAREAPAGVRLPIDLDREGRDQEEW